MYFSEHWTYRVIRKKGNEVLFEGSMEDACNYLNIVKTTFVEHFRDRNNPGRYPTCPWRLELVDDGD